jgi:hypothetical protein
LSIEGGNGNRIVLIDRRIVAARWAMALLGEAMNRLRQEYAIGPTWPRLRR